MPANSDPIFSKNGRIGSALVSASLAGTDGVGVIGTNIFLGLAADATNGTYVQRVRWTLTGSAGNIASTATVGNVFVASTSSGSTATSTAFLVSSTVLPALTSAPSAAVGPWFDISLGFVLPAGYAILASNTNNPNAGTAWRATVFGGDY